MFLVLVAAAALSCSAIDGDTLKCGKERIRLTEIDSPEMPSYSGRAAKEKMKTMIAGEKVHCVRRGKDRYGRTLAACSNSGGDLSRQMLNSGHARKYYKKNKR
jgi:micrococcal nuclease